MPPPSPLMLERALEWWFNGGQQWHRSKLHLDCSSPSAVHPTRNRHSLDPPPPDRSRASSVRACVDGLLRDAEETSGMKAVAPAAGSGGGGGGGGGGIGGGGGSGGGGSGSGGGGGGGSGGSGGNHGHGGSRAAGSSSRDANAEREAGAGGSRSHNANGKRPAAYSSGHSPRPPQLASTSRCKPSMAAVAAETPPPAPPAMAAVAAVRQAHRARRP